MFDILEGRYLPSTNVLTYHNDNARTGDDLHETVLTPADVNPSQFGKLYSVPVDGQVYAQPLYLENVAVPGQGAHNVVYVATENDTVYAFDADRGALLWHDSLANPAAGVTPVPSGDLQCPSITPQIGVTATPVIDPASGTLYAVAAFKVLGRHKARYVQRIFAIDVATGALKLGGPRTIRASVPGAGDGGTAVTFNGKKELSRAALLLLDGVVYTAWTSHCDATPTHGWVIGYRADTLKRVAVFNTSPGGQLSTIWQSGGGLAADAAGNIYFLTGNGTFDANHGGRDYGDSFVRLRTHGRLRAADYFTPFNQAGLSAHDDDLGSGGPLLLPDQPGAPGPLLVGASKAGTIYLLDRGHLGRFHRRSDRVVQELGGAVGRAFDTPAYFDGGGQRWLYYAGENDVVRAFPLVGGRLAPVPSSASGMPFFTPGATPSVSADGTSGGIVWALNVGPPGLYAFDATDLGHLLYSSDQFGVRDQLDGVIKFSVPTVADGKVFVGTSQALTVYGELGP
jgi:outer membrane protein assembly factor BamB